MTKNNVYLVWLDWPEKCFRADSRQIAFLRTLVPDGSEVVRVRSEKAFLRRLGDATHAIVWNFKKEWFAKAPRLKLLATPGAGRELVAGQADAPDGVIVHFGGFHGAIMSETVAGFILAWSHGFFDPALKTDPALPWRETWPRAALSASPRNVAGTKAVIAGCGRVGRAIAGTLRSLGVEVAGVTRKNADETARLAADADWLVMALPGDTGTDGFLDGRLLRALPRRAVVVNVGRGNAIDEDALLEALRTKKIAGAYLDVFASEPGPLAYGKGKTGGILSTPLRDLPPTLVMTPHSSAFCDRYIDGCFKELYDEGCLRG